MVEGGRKRVKAVLFPGKDGKGGKPGAATPAKAPNGTNAGPAPAKAADAKPAPGAVSKAGEAAR